MNTFRSYFILSAPLLTVLRLFRFDDGREVVEIDSTSITDDQTTFRATFSSGDSYVTAIYTARLHFFFLSRTIRTLFRLLNRSGGAVDVSKVAVPGLFITDDVHFHSGID